MLKTTLFSLICIISPSSYSFEIYQFLNWHYLKMPDGEVKYSKKVIDYDKNLSSIGMKKMNVIYSVQILTDNRPDYKKIKKIVEATKIDPYTPICFDIEIGVANKPETNLPVILGALNIYHKIGGKAPIGVYGVLPQRTPNKIISKKQRNDFILLNKKYEEIAKNVDFISPTLYFYSLQNMDIWKNKAQFNMQEAKKYANQYNLKIYPFISLSNWEIRNKKFFVTPISESNMDMALAFLESQGANGVVLWESGSSRQANDEMPAVFDMNKDSFKSVVNILNRNK
ncbi:hypothetical protein [Acinetobacter sp. BIGb0102]|uniref:hypothetical protein n=1 Tax=Acinetobacter sp. BIGb0102 TaxID=2485131 RepID=UPI000F4FB003|nr:hypothetical protein [Acinetobacter sp. BIGb0102]